MHLVHVVADPSGLPWTAEAFAVPLHELVAGWQEQARHDLLQLLPPEERAGTTIGTPLGRPDVEIIRYATGHHVELIVVGTHGRGGLQHFVLGSVAERVARRAPCAVLIARQPAAT